MYNDKSNSEIMSYIAGLVDLRGSFYINENFKNEKLSSFRAWFSIILSYRPILEIFEREFNGKLALQKAKKSTNFPLNRPYWRIVLYGKKLDCFLEKIYPFLIIQRKPCKILMDIRSTMRDGYRSSRPIPSSVLTYRRNLIKELKTYHRKERKDFSKYKLN